MPNTYPSRRTFLITASSSAVILGSSHRVVGSRLKPLTWSVVSDSDSDGLWLTDQPEASDHVLCTFDHLSDAELYLARYGDDG